MKPYASTQNILTHSHTCNHTYTHKHKLRYSQTAYVYELLNDIHFIVKSNTKISELMQRN